MHTRSLIIWLLVFITLLVGGCLWLWTGGCASTQPPEPTTSASSSTTAASTSTTTTSTSSTTTITLSGTWSAQNSGTSYNLGGLQFVDINNGWIFTTYPPMLRTINGGISYEALPSSKSNPISACFVDQNTGWAAWTDNILKTEDGGNSWSINSSFSYGNGVYFLDHTTGWAYSGTGNIQKTTDEGTTWIPQISGTANPINKLRFFDQNAGWALADNLAIPNNRIILQTSDGGANWAVKGSIGGAGTDFSILGLYFVDPNYGWGVGFYGGSGNLAAIFKSTDGGATWTAQNSGAHGILDAVYFVDQNTGWAAGSGGTILKTIDGGDHWYPQSSGISSNLAALYFVDLDTGWAVGDGGVILKYSP